jgi:hypothetical protein
MRIQNNKKVEKVEEEESGRFAGMLKQLDGLLGGGAEKKEEEAREFILQRLGNVLNNNFTLLLNYPLPNTAIEVPMILVGPPGVKVIYPSALRGIFRAEEDGWYELNERKRTYVPAKTNIVRQIRMVAGRLQKFLLECGVNLEEIEPVLLFSDPGSHVDSANSAVRIILRDGINNFVAGLVQASQVIKSEDVLNVTAMITRPSMAKQQAAKVRGDQPADSPAFAEEEIFPSGAAGADDQPEWMRAIAEPVIAEEESAEPDRDRFADLTDKLLSGNLFEKAGFSATQWVVLAVMGGLICLVTLAASMLLFF